MFASWRKPAATAEVQLRRSRKSTYTDPIKDSSKQYSPQELADLKQYIADFYRTIYKRRDECTQICAQYPKTVGYFYATLVPRSVSFEDFWQRYFYRCSVDRVIGEWDQQALEKKQQIQQSMQTAQSILSNAMTTTTPEAEVEARRLRKSTYTEPLRDPTKPYSAQELADMKQFVSDFYTTIYKREKECHEIAQQQYPKSVGQFYNILVPRTVSLEDFWQRYFFRCDVERVTKEWEQQAAEKKQAEADKKQQMDDRIQKSMQHAQNFMSSALGTKKEEESTTTLESIAKAEVMVRRGQQETYTQPLRDKTRIYTEQELADLKQYRYEFYNTIYKRKAECDEICKNHPKTVGHFHETLVPRTVTFEDFWQRYFYRCDVDRLVQEKEQQVIQEQQRKEAEMERDAIDEMLDPFSSEAFVKHREAALDVLKTEIVSVSSSADEQEVATKQKPVAVTPPASPRSPKTRTSPTKSVSSNTSSPSRHTWASAFVDEYADTGVETVVTEQENVVEMIEENEEPSTSSSEVDFTEEEAPVTPPLFQSTEYADDDAMDTTTGSFTKAQTMIDNSWAEALSESDSPNVPSTDAMAGTSNDTPMMETTTTTERVATDHQATTTVVDEMPTPKKAKTQSPSSGTKQGSNETMKSLFGFNNSAPDEAASLIDSVTSEVDKALTTQPNVPAAEANDAKEQKEQPQPAASEPVTTKLLRGFPSADPPETEKTTNVAATDIMEPPSTETLLRGFPSLDPPVAKMEQTTSVAASDDVIEPPSTEKLLRGFPSVDPPVAKMEKTTIAADMVVEPPSKTKIADRPPTKDDTRKWNFKKATENHKQAQPIRTSSPVIVKKELQIMRDGASVKSMRDLWKANEKVVPPQSEVKRVRRFSKKWGKESVTEPKGATTPIKEKATTVEKPQSTNKPTATLTEAKAPKPKQQATEVEKPQITNKPTVALTDAKEPEPKEQAAAVEKPQLTSKPTDAIGGPQPLTQTMPSEDAKAPTEQATEVEKPQITNKPTATLTEAKGATPTEQAAAVEKPQVTNKPTATLTEAEAPKPKQQATEVEKPQITNKPTATLTEAEAPKPKQQATEVEKPQITNKPTATLIEAKEPEPQEQAAAVEKPQVTNKPTTTLTEAKGSKPKEQAAAVEKPQLTNKPTDAIGDPQPLTQTMPSEDASSDTKKAAAVEKDQPHQPATQKPSLNPDNVEPESIPAEQEAMDTHVTTPTSILGESAVTGSLGDTSLTWSDKGSASLSPTKRDVPTSAQPVTPLKPATSGSVDKKALRVSFSDATKKPSDLQPQSTQATKTKSSSMPLNLIVIVCIGLIALGVGAAIHLYQDFLCAPVAMGEVSISYSEAPFWAPPKWKPTAFSLVCGTNRRRTYLYWSDLHRDTRELRIEDETYELLKLGRLISARVESDRIVVTDKKGNVEVVDAPWLSMGGT